MKTKIISILLLACMVIGESSCGIFVHTKHVDAGAGVGANFKKDHITTLDTTATADRTQGKSALAFLAEK